MAETLQGRTVLVTGAAGFIGSHVTERLVREGARVKALVRYRGDGTWGWLDQSPVRGDIEVLAGDLQDADVVRRAAGGCETIFHLGALIAIPYSYVAPRSYVTTNVEGTLNVLEAARAAGGARVIHTSTSEVYGTPDSVPITESHALKAQSPYSASKIGADKIAESYFATWGLPVVILRPFNTYGPRQSARAVLPTILSQLLAGAERLTLGALSPRRDLTYVLDTVDGFIRAAVTPEAAGQTIQLGTGTDVSIEELAKLCMKVTGRDVPIDCDEQRLRPAGSEVERLLSRPARAAEVLGWRPTTSLEDGLSATAAWVEANLRSFKPDSYAV
ncbi:MAG: GDP-mannose 4,6-dehydratase [Acidobacteriota bacterium]|nr:GDP-mannose 4,6-dehydratase [Acidobacteriota bacterium]